MKKTNDTPPSWSQTRMTVRFRDEKEEKIKEALEIIANIKKTSVNSLFIEIMEDYLKKEHQTLPLDNILKIINDELEGEVKFSESEEITLEKWFYHEFRNKEIRKEFLLQWFRYIITQDFLNYGNTKNVIEGWETLVQQYGVINYMSEIDFEALKQLYFDYLNECFLLEKIGKKDSIKYQLVPQRKHIPDIIVEMVKKMPQTQSSEEKMMIDGLLTSSISPIVDVSKLSKEEQNNISSKLLFVLLIGIIERYIFHFNKSTRIFESSINILDHLFTYCKKVKLENVESGILPILYHAITRLDECVQNFREQFITKKENIKPYPPLKSPFIKKLRGFVSPYEASRTSEFYSIILQKIREMNK